MISEKYIFAFINAVNQCLKNTTKALTPETVNQIRFQVRALFISYAFGQSISKNKHTTFSEIDNWICTTLSSQCIFHTIISNSPESLKKYIESVELPRFEGDLGSLYEKFLLIDANQISAKEGKRFRNETGSYFTPKGLADATIYNIIKANYTKDTSSLATAKVADFSCGSGVFLTRYLNIVAKYSSVPKKQLIKNIYGFDVDPLVLEIAKLNVLAEVNDYSLYSKISPNFILCNFLLRAESSYPDTDKIVVSSSGFIYDDKLTLNTKNILKYDIILGNPPWEKIRLEEKAIKKLYNFSQDKNLALYINKSKNDIECAKKRIKKDSYFGEARNGELNTYALFTQAAFNQLSDNGILGLIVKSSLFTSQVYSKLFKYLRGHFVSIYDFINSKKIFEIDGRERFAIICISKSETLTTKVGMNLSSIEEISTNTSNIKLTDCDIINPLTGTLPNLSSIKELEYLINIHKHSKLFSEVYPEAKFGRIVHLTNHKDSITRNPNIGYIPIYEGKFIAQYDADYSGFNNIPYNLRYTAKATSQPISIKDKLHGVHAESRYFISEHKWKELSHNYSADYMLAWHSLTSATNTNTCVATILPFMPTCQSIQFLTIPNEYDLLYLTGLFNSRLFDLILKKKLNGIDLTRTIISQMPVPCRNCDKYILIKGNNMSATDVIVGAVCILLQNDDRLTNLLNKYSYLKDKLESFSKRELSDIIEYAISSLYS